MADLRLQLQLFSGSENSLPINKRKSRSIDSEKEHRVRHKHHSQKEELHHLRKTVKTLLVDQSQLQNQVRELTISQETATSNLLKIENQLKLILGRMKSPNPESSVRAQSDNKKLLDQMEALAVKVSGVDKIQSSTLQLFEALETLEDKCDEGLSDVKKEISKLEFNGAQMASTLHSVQEDISKSNEQLRTVRSSIAVLQESLKVEQIRSVKIQAFQLNKTTNECEMNARHNLLEARVSQMESRMAPQFLPSSPSAGGSGAAATSIDRFHLVENYTENGGSQENDEVKSKLIRLEHRYNQLIHNLPKDCSATSASSGVNVIYPGTEDGETMKVFCDQETSGGGWMLFQRRTDDKEDFNRNWAAYKNGFGSAYGDYWLGNDHLHALTASNSTSLRVDMWDIYGQYWWAEYDHFRVDNESNGYALDVSGFRGNASDAMAYHRGMNFSTRDNDQDLSNTNCADSYQGGWWYSHCQHVNVNGKFSLGLTWYDSQENEWIAISRVEMKIRQKKTE
nr:EOG090X02LG [Eulimnadia texana]